MPRWRTTPISTGYDIVAPLDFGVVASDGVGVAANLGAFTIHAIVISPHNFGVVTDDGVVPPVDFGVIAKPSYVLLFDEYSLVERFLASTVQ